MGKRRLRIVRRLLQWGRQNSRQYPWRDPTTSPFQTLIAETLLKRTTSTAAARLYPTFIAHFPSFSAIAEAPAVYLEDSLRPIGLYKQRAAGLKRMAEHVQLTLGGELPREVESLEGIPHAGPYAARAVSSFAYGVKAAVVDSNVERIFKRVFRHSLPDRPRASTVQQIADALIPHRAHRLFNYALLDLGATVCRYVRPRCCECPLAGLCDSAVPTATSP